MRRPLVSVITPTWQRHELLLEAIENVRQQTYRPIEHVIVSDGPDNELRRMLVSTELRKNGLRIDPNGWPVLVDPEANTVPVFFTDAGRNWSSFMPDSFCAAPMLVGQFMARGTYQAWLADDERMEPDHIASLVDALESEAADFAYSRVRLYHVGQTPEQGFDIGTPTPTMGQITNVLYRSELLRRGLYPLGCGMTSDWACISQWINAGARWAYVDRVTLTHRTDH
jgi:GT2 family glycosyltransferase